MQKFDAVTTNDSTQNASALSQQANFKPWEFAGKTEPQSNPTDLTNHGFPHASGIFADSNILGGGGSADHVYRGSAGGLDPSDHVDRTPATGLDPADHVDRTPATGLDPADHVDRTPATGLDPAFHVDRPGDDPTPRFPTEPDFPIPLEPRQPEPKVPHKPIDGPIPPGKPHEPKRPAPKTPFEPEPKDGGGAVPLKEHVDLQIPSLWLREREPQSWNGGHLT